MRSFWPVGEAAQGDYEQLRAAVLAGTPLINAAARRFERSGMAGLVAAPSLAAIFSATLVGANRAPWTPYADPRHEALAEGYGIVLGVAEPHGGALGLAGTADAQISSSGSAPSRRQR